MTLFKDVVDLLHNNDCVILPGFGAFVLKKKAASVVGNKFSPPSKNISFNSMLKENDGLLVKQISRTRKISYIKLLVLLKKRLNHLGKNSIKTLLLM